MRNWLPQAENSGPIALRHRISLGFAPNKILTICHYSFEDRLSQYDMVKLHNFAYYV